MSVAQQAKAFRRKAKIDPRYQQGRRDATANAKKLKEQIERERRMAQRKK